MVKNMSIYSLKLGHDWEGKSGAILGNWGSILGLKMNSKFEFQDEFSRADSLKSLRTNAKKMVTVDS